MTEKPVRKKKQAMTFRVSTDTQRRIVELADKLGIDRTATVELAVKEAAKRKGVS